MKYKKKRDGFYLSHFDCFEDYPDDEGPIIFSALEIVENDKYLYLKGIVGYTFDPKNLELVYDLKENKIYVLNKYRYLNTPDDFRLFKDSFDIVKGINLRWENDTLIENKTGEYELDEKKENRLPYYRFPRSKDGISIPRLIYNIFKVYSQDGEKPKIIIPDENYLYHKN